jgi:hypothetical protein
MVRNAAHTPQGCFFPAAHEAGSIVLAKQMALKESATHSVNSAAASASN